MTTPFRIPIGIIEGFFGRPWRWEDRAACASFLAEIGFDFYIYAPKDDRYLRQRWREPWPEAIAAELAALAGHYRDRGVRFGIGLSPFELHLADGDDDRPALRAKLRELNAIDPDVLCILFDDMRGDIPELASRQARIVDDVCEASTARAFIVCPTYYSFDPIVEKVFGPMPAGYLDELGRRLDATVDVLWTGPRVCSRSYPAEHLDAVAGLLRRRPFLWDNYPVNDSAAMAPFLHIGPFRDRPVRLLEQLAGHAVNPMNQAWLSRVPLASLADSYRQGDDYDADRSFAEACRRHAGAELGALLAADLELVQSRGLGGLTDAERQTLDARYDRFRGHPCADEVLAWLAGDFAFDPACLT